MKSSEGRAGLVTLRDRDATIVFYGDDKSAILLEYKGVLYDCDWDFIDHQQAEEMITRYGEAQ